ncbi:hypothetical protein Tco_0025854 [Tanacetum coccineum]
MKASSSRSINTCSNEFYGKSMDVPLTGWKSGDRQVHLCYQCLIFIVDVLLPPHYMMRKTVNSSVENQKFDSEETNDNTTITPSPRVNGDTTITLTPRINDDSIIPTPRVSGDTITSTPRDIDDTTVTQTPRVNGDTITPTPHAIDDTAITLTHHTIDDTTI